MFCYRNLNGPHWNIRNKVTYFGNLPTVEESGGEYKRNTY